MSKTCRGVLWLLVLFIVIGFKRQDVAASCRSLDGFVKDNAFAVADPDGTIIDSCRLDQPMMPASILKIATVSAALDILGPDHRFVTEFYSDKQDNLYIKGLGDPTLMAEEVQALAARLHQLGLRRVNTLYVDNSAFALEHQVPGQEQSDNPYDAPVGPLSVNFNSVPLQKNASGTIQSAESQTPLLPIMEELGRGKQSGIYRINICTGGCAADKRMAQYAGELFQVMLHKAGVGVSQYGGLRPVPPQAVLIYTHQSSQTLREISATLLHYSSNFMANLVFLACGVKQYGYPATWTKARKAVQGVMSRQLDRSLAATIVQVEGSGLSRDNQVTARAMLRLLHVFQPNKELLGRERGVLVKTGTLTGVYNYAGYLPDGRAFVILLNQQANKRAAVLAQLLQRFPAIPVAKLPVAPDRSANRQATSER